MNPWYATLNRPALTPPDWIFGPVWTVLYVMIGLSVVFYYRTPVRSYMWLTTGVLVLHLISNFIWTLLFFRLHSPAAALADILVLDISLVILILSFWTANKPAAILLLPYLAWVSFATYLNYGFYKLN